MYNEDYLHAIGEKFRPRPDNLKLMLVAGSAIFSAIIMIALLTGFYWNGTWNLETPAGEKIVQPESQHTDEAETHKEPPAQQH